MIHIKYNPIMFTSNVSTIYADGHKYVVARIETVRMNYEIIISLKLMNSERKCMFNSSAQIRRHLTNGLVSPILPNQTSFQYKIF